MDFTQFRGLVGRIEFAAENADGASARAIFTDDAVIVEPPDKRFIQGGADIADYFTSGAPGTQMDVHHVWFSESEQTGAVEFSYAPNGNDDVTHGIFLLTLDGDRVSHWREYAYPGPRSFAEFLRVDGKKWIFTVSADDAL